MHRLDAVQQRNRPAAFVVAVVKKFGDDRGGMLCALLTYYGFLALFPLMLLLVTVLGLALRNDPSLQQRVLDSALSDFPVIGDQLRSNIHALRVSTLALIVGIVGLVWGSLGVTQAAQFAMAQIWNIEGKDRPGFATRLARGLVFIGALGLGVVVTTLLAQLGAFGGGGGRGTWLRVVLIVAGIVANVGLYVVAFRLLTPKHIATGDLIPGAVGGGLAWSALQFLGAYLVEHQLRHTSEVYGVFAVVLGLLAWLYLTAQVTLYAAEVNVVRARRLWPRTLAPPPLTGADRVVLRDIARQETRRPEQHVDVDFDVTGAQRRE